MFHVWSFDRYVQDPLYCVRHTALFGEWSVNDKIIMRSRDVDEGYTNSATLLKVAFC